MKSLFPVFLVLLVAVAHAQDDFWLTVSGTGSSSSYIYASETQSVLFNAGLQIQDAKDIVQALKSYVVNPSRTLTYVFILSDTPSSYLGLETIVQAFPNVTVWAAPNVAASILKKYKSDIPLVAAAGYKNINNQIPKINQLTGSSFTVGSTKFEVYEFEGVSSNWTSTVWVPSQRSLLTGDLFSNGVFPKLAFAAAANSFDKWRVTLTELASTYSPISVIYPGFGAVVKTATAAAFDAARKFMDDFKTAIQPPNTLAEALENLKVKYPLWAQAANLQQALEAALPASICSLNCRGKTCGDDGCGGCCGVCEEPFACNGYGQCECVPQCDGTHCGADGCGGTCGSCQYGVCQADGTCACTPVCSEGSCGSNGCGGSCGCDTGYTCNGEGMCVEPAENVVDLLFNFAGLATFDCTTNPGCKL